MALNKISKNMLEKSFVDEVDAINQQVESANQQLAEKVGGVVKAKMEDLDDEVISAVTGGATVNVLSIPQDESVTFRKTNFLSIGKNKFNKDKATIGTYLNGVGDSMNAESLYVSDYESVEPSTTYTRKFSAAINFYDASLNRISYQTPTLTFATPASARFARLNGSVVDINNEQLELGSASTAYEGYGIKFNKYLPKSIPEDALNVDFETLKTDAYPFIPLATLVTNPGVNVSPILKKAIKKVELYGADPSKKYSINIIQKNYLTYGTGIYIAENNTNGSFKSQAAFRTFSGAVDSGISIFEVYESDGSGVRARVWIDWSEIPDGTQYSFNSFAKSGFDERVKVPVIQISLPSALYAVVGDTLEIFYKGIIQAVNPFDYNIVVSASKGNAYKNRWIYTPVAGDGNFNLTISVHDNQNVKLAEKVAQVRVSAVKASPTALKQILAVGDSLTNAGTWVKELDRRLTMAGGSPAGNSLTNIDFIGSKVNEDTGYEGYGGWTWQSYNSNIVPLKYWVTVTSGMKTETLSEQSIWSDGTRQWQLETIDVANNKLKFKQYPEGGNYAMPTSGTLTFVSGGGDTANITFNASAAESGNPFWNTATSQLDFTKYVSNGGYNGIDHCYILLGWNNTSLTGAQLVTEGKKFVDALKTAYPNVKVGIIGLQVPSIDGMGANYGAAASWNYYTKLLKVFEFNKAYEDWTKESAYSGFMSFVHLSSQFDTENNMPQGTRTVNVRNAKTEVYGTNGVHPEYEGYMQIADAAYRNLMHKL